MAALDFPSPATPGQQFQAPTGILYQYGTPARWMTAQALPLNSQMSAEDNLISNGGFDVWQRGTSFSPTSGASGVKVADRWKVECGAGTTLSASQSVAAPGAAGASGEPLLSVILVHRTVTGSVYTWLNQPIEDVRTAAGQTVTVSFQAYSNVAGSAFAVAFNQYFGTGGSPSATVFGTQIPFTMNAANTWERKVITTTIPSISGKTLGTNGDHNLQFYLGMGNTLGNFDFLFTNFDLRLGSVAPVQFLRRPQEQELALCQRYYQIFSGFTSSGYQAAGGHIFTEIGFPVQMRAVPTVTYSGPPTYNNASGLTTSGAYVNHLRAELVITAAGFGYATANVTLDAEL